MGRLALDPGQIKAVRRVGGGYWLEYDAGSFNLYGNMEGFEDFLSRLRALNPAVRVGGVPGFS